MPGVQLAWVRSAAELDDADWIVLPGSKQVSGDLAWLRRQGLDAAIARHAAAGRPVLGICGGLQMLGEALVDPDGHDGEAGFNGPGLGLLPLVTRYERDKRVRRTHAALRATARPGRRAASRHRLRDPLRRDLPHPDLPAAAVALRDDHGEAIGWQHGNVLGVYAHGCSSRPRCCARCGARPRRRSTTPSIGSPISSKTSWIAACWLDCSRPRVRIQSFGA